MPNHDHDTIPTHTTLAQAQSCEALEPMVQRFVDALWIAVGKRSEAAAGDANLELMRRMLGDVRKVIAGSGLGWRLRPVRLTEKMSLFALAVAATALPEALAAFRSRHFGWNAALGGVGWFLAGDAYGEAAQSLMPRSTAAPPPGHDANMARMRQNLAKRIDQLMEEREQQQATGTDSGSPL